MRSLVLLSPVVLAVACSGPDVVVPDALDVAPSAPEASAGDTGGWGALDGVDQVRTGHGWMQGSLGGVQGIEGALRTARVRSIGDVVEFELDVDEGGWALLAGGLQRSLIGETGQTTLEPNEHWVIGCSGPTMAEMDFDTGADVVAIGQALSGDEVTYTLTAWFHDGSEVTAAVTVPTE